MTATVTSQPVRWAPLAAPIACGCCLAAGAAYVVATDPAEGGAFLPCPFRTLTGWWCPGCGLTRATHHLLRGEVTQALRYNLFVVVILAGFAWGWVAWLRHSAGRSADRSMAWVSRVPVRVQVAAGAMLVGFAVVRNVPGIPGLRG